MENKVDEPDISGCNGNCREIFLFSNGQHDSPPRKYHLRVNEQWDATLKRLANSQYASNHIIDLYTVDGKKIEGPQEITNGTAYVAVEPPTAFEPAGYLDYLTKASRSREKRQDRISERDLLTEPDKINSKDKIEEERNESLNIIQDVITLPTNVIAAEDYNSITNKNTSDTPRNVKRIKRISIVKQTENKSGAVPQRNPLNVKKNTNQVDSGVKVNKTSKVDVIKKKFETPFLKSTKNTKTPTKPNIVVTNTTGSNGDKAVYVKQASYNQEYIPPTDLQKETAITSLSNAKTAKLKAPRDLTVDTSTASTNRENGVLLPVLVSYDKDQREPEHFNPLKIPATVDAFSKDQEYRHSITDGSPSSRNQHVRPPERVCDTENEQAVLNDTLNELSQTITIFIGSQSGDKSLSIYLKQGSIVNLKLNVAVPNEPNIVVEKIDNSPANTMQFGVNTSKSGNQTQGNITVVAKNCREASVLTERELIFEQICKISNDSKVAICNYNCCPCFANPEHSVLARPKKNNSFISLPLEKHNETFISCTCKKVEVNQHNKGDNIQENIVQSEFSQHNKDLVHDPIPNEDHLLPKKLWELPAAFPGVERPTTSSRVLNQHAPVTDVTTFREAFTQTDWSGIVLEVRPREDGSYEFHLPSLETMKLYNVLY